MWCSLFFNFLLTSLFPCLPLAFSWYTANTTTGMTLLLTVTSHIVTRMMSSTIHMTYKDYTCSAAEGVRMCERAAAILLWPTTAASLSPSPPPASTLPLPVAMQKLYLYACAPPRTRDLGGNKRRLCARTLSLLSDLIYWCSLLIVWTVCVSSPVLYSLSLSVCLPLSVSCVTSYSNTGAG